MGIMVPYSHDMVILCIGMAFYHKGTIRMAWRLVHNIRDKRMYDAKITEHELDTIYG